MSNFHRALAIQSRVKEQWAKELLKMDDIDSLMAEELDVKGNKLWERGVREVLGDVEFERLYSELTK